MPRPLLPPSIAVLSLLRWNGRRGRSVTAGMRENSVVRREERLSENEALFRAVNERIEEAASGEAAEQLFEIFCECADLDCLERIEISRGSYEQARAEPDLFIVRPGHEQPTVEEVIVETRTYLLIRKTGDASAIAAELDPRA
jgi:hypothetical protein